MNTTRCQSCEHDVPPGTGITTTKSPRMVAPGFFRDFLVWSGLTTLCPPCYRKHQEAFTARFFKK